MTLQEGIYHAPGARPGRAFVIFFLRAAPDVDAGTVGAALGRLWDVWRGLARGSVVDLPGHPVPADALTVLVGYGQKAFALPGARRTVPAALLTGSFRSPHARGGGPVVVGSGLSYSPEVQQNPATEEVVVQAVADTQLAVNRVVVETWKVVHDETDLGTTEVIQPGNEGFREPPDVIDPVVRRSHVHRANRHVGPATDANSLRIFRQGYEFLEPHGAASGFRAGLNFVSFQDTPHRVVRMLRQPGWLGGTNFGGDPATDPVAAAHLLSVQAGGTHVVPPVDPAEAFPGARLFS